MTQVYVKYNPYRLETELKVNGKVIPTDSMLYKVTKGKRMQEWIGQFPKMLREELNTVDLSLEFCGMPLDWDDFEDAFEQAKRAGVVRVSEMRFSEGKSDDDINEKIVKVFEDLQSGPIDDFRDERLKKAFDNINCFVFGILKKLKKAFVPFAGFKRRSPYAVIYISIFFCIFQVVCAKERRNFKIFC